jgi:predicted neutral ceramidase superfamily lipid hydrolase
MTNILQAGLAKSTITPPAGISMTGYATRPSNAAGVHDDLFCKVSVFSNGETTAALVCLDLLGLNFEQVRWIRDEVENRLGIPGSHVFVACSHTHAGPATVLLRFCGTPDDSYLPGMLETIVETVGKAKQDLAPCSIKTGEAERSSPGLFQ